jgi:hypothetical protein
MVDFLLLVDVLAFPGIEKTRGRLGYTCLGDFGRASKPFAVVTNPMLKFLEEKCVSEGSRPSSMGM